MYLRRLELQISVVCRFTGFLKISKLNQTMKELLKTITFEKLKNRLSLSIPVSFIQAEFKAYGIIMLYVCVCVPFQFLKQLIDFHEMLHSRFPPLYLQNITLYNFSNYLLLLCETS